MKKLNKKGFTIVELVIVIAVIAILAAVMVPTFTGIVKKAQASSRYQLASSAYKAALGVSDEGSYNDNAEGTNADLYIAVEDGSTTYYYAVVDGKVSDKAEVSAPDLTDWAPIDLEETLNDVTVYQPNA